MCRISMTIIDAVRNSEPSQLERPPYPREDLGGPWGCVSYLAASPRIKRMNKNPKVIKKVGKSPPQYPDQ